jgi:formylglycine-generating enzyme required for sulfatase activity
VKHKSSAALFGVLRSEFMSTFEVDWVSIPAGPVVLLETGQDYDVMGGIFGDYRDYITKTDAYGFEFDLQSFEITRHPITSGQFLSFVEAGGYETPQWWLKEGWDDKNQNDKPDRQRLNPELLYHLRDEPMLVTSWYEAMAFCAWAGGVLGKGVWLPTEGQWQRAAESTLVTSMVSGEQTFNLTEWYSGRWRGVYRGELCLTDWSTGDYSFDPFNRPEAHYGDRHVCKGRDTLQGRGRTSGWGDGLHKFRLVSGLFQGGARERKVPRPPLP